MAVPATREEFMSLLKRMDGESPSAEDIETFRNVLEVFPILTELAGNFSKQCQDKLIEATKMTPAAREMMRAHSKKLNGDLIYNSSPILETLISELIIICYLILIFVAIRIRHPRRELYDRPNLGFAVGTPYFFRSATLSAGSGNTRPRAPAGCEHTGEYRHSRLPINESIQTSSRTKGSQYGNKYFEQNC
jgi:hypothetical protein